MGFFWSTPTKPVENKSIQRYKQKNILWIDFQHEDFDELTKLFRVLRMKTVDDALLFLDEFHVLEKIKVICSGSLAEQFLHKLKQNYKQIKIAGVYIYCFKIEIYQYLKQNQLVKCVENQLQKLVETLSTQMIDFQMPNFRRFCDQTEKTNQLIYSYMLTGISVQTKDLKKRQKLFDKFLTSLKKYRQKENIQNINYPLFINHQKVLTIYSGVQVHSYVNSLLKTNISKYIQNAQIVISDLYHAIKQSSIYEVRNKIIATICYRIANISQAEIDLLPQLVGEYIEFLGFLSTSVNRQYLQQEFQGNSLFTIYIPDFIKSKQSSQLLLRGGYVDMRGISYFPEQQQILFNIKTVMRVIRFYTEETIKGKINSFNLIYGIDEIICHIYRNKHLFQFDLKQKNTENNVEYSHAAEIYVIGAVSKTKKCLIDFMKEDFQNESFFVVNTQTKLTGMVLTYSEEIEKDISEKRKKLKNKNICQICEAIVKCSDCKVPLCLCSLRGHDQEHLKSSIIMIESQIPRFIQLSLHKENVSFFNTYRQVEGKISCIADGYLNIKQIASYNQAKKLYDEIINKTDEFSDLSSQTKFKMYFNRGESIRLKKYVVNAPPVTIEQFEHSLMDYHYCLDIAESQLKNQSLIAKSLLHIGIIEDDLKRYDTALDYYEKATKVLNDIEKKRDLTFEEKNIKISIKNCEGFYYMHIKDHEKGQLVFKQAIEELNTIENHSLPDKAKYYNNLTFCLNCLGRYDQSVKTGKISYQLRLLIFGKEHNLTKNSLNNYSKAKSQLQKIEKN